MQQLGEWVPREYWQSIHITCACGREHGGHRIELWEASPGGTYWVGERCGTLTIDPPDIAPGTGGPGLAPEDRAPRSRLRLRAGDWPTWTATCRHCDRHVRIRGERLVRVLNGLAAVGRTHIELAAVGRLARAE